MKKKKIKTGWKEYFNFSARERRGSLLLSLIIFIQITVLFYLQTHVNEPIPTDEKIMQQLIAEDAHEKHLSLKNTELADSIQPSMTPFDPNKITDSTSLPGLSEKQIQIIHNYLKHGGKFRSKIDFRKVYGISEKQYAMLNPFLLLPDSFEKKTSVRNQKSPQKELIDLNTADSLELMNLRGIGPVFASRIVRYREKLGGFFSKEQLKEVWGFTDSLYDKLLPSIVLKNETPFRYIHLNTDSFAVIAAHPYFKGKLAAMICSYRKQHQGFSEKEELKQLPLVNEENFRKISPYIRLD